MNEEKKDVIFLLKVYDDSGRLLPNVLPFRSEKSARETALEWVPKGCTWEVVASELSD